MSRPQPSRSTARRPQRSSWARRTGQSGCQRSAKRPEGATGDVWWVTTGRLDWQRLVPLLDGGEQGRLASLRRDTDRERFVLGAALVRGAVAERLEVAVTDVRLDRRCDRCGAPHGRPQLAAPARALHLSVSHSGAVVGVATASVDVGLDVERVDCRDTDVLVRTALTERERSALDSYVDDPRSGRTRTAGALRLWTRKEALTKMTGAGLRAALTDIEVTGPGAAAELRSWAGAGLTDGQVTLRDLRPPASEHVAAVAVRERAAMIAQYDGAALLSRLAGAARVAGGPTR